MRKVETDSPKEISLLGATGSIGDSTLDIVAKHPNSFKIVGLTANKNVEKLIAQALKFQPKAVAIADERHFDTLKSALADTNIEVLAGKESIVEIAKMESDFVMAGIVGAAGLLPTMAAVEQGHVVGLANKECLVCAGSLLMEAVQKHGATVLPVDSEHNAIFQVLEDRNAPAIDRIILTASGGPFREMARDEMMHQLPEDALAHPNWDMGAKISIDSATMMNKGLELIEAYHLFPVDKNQIEILVHPESIVHSMVQYADGSTLAQMGQPDMRIPIAFALNWPKRQKVDVARLDLAKIGTLNFQTPDEIRFPALRLARSVLDQGGSAPIVLNAANEVAVELFLSKAIKFGQICQLIEETLVKFDHFQPNSLAEIENIDKESRILAKKVRNGLDS